MWEMDVIGPINPPSSRGNQFILAITDYFSKSAEAISLREVKATDAVKLVKHHVVYRFGVLRRIMHNNETQFICNTFQHFCRKFSIQSMASTVYYLRANGPWKCSVRRSQSCLRSLSLRVNVIRMKLMDLLHNGSDSDKVNTVLSGICMWGHPPLGDSDFVPQSHHLNWYDGWGQAHATSRAAERSRRGTTCGVVTDRALSSSNLQGVQQEDQNAHF